MAATSALEAWEACDKADTVFILVCSGLLLAAVGLGYSGYSTRRSGLASFHACHLGYRVLLNSLET
jgi:hypothetical protein